MTRLFQITTSPFRRVPDFYVVGAPKAGTTSLHSYLSLHPQILPSVFMKESRFLLGSGGLKLRTWSYRSFFPFRWSGPAGALTFDADPLMGVIPDCAAAFISHVSPKAKIIFVCREPVERLWSQYRFLSGIKGRPDTGAPLSVMLETERRLQNALEWDGAARLAKALEKSSTSCPVPPGLAGVVLRSSLLRAGRYADVLDAFHKRLGPDRCLFLPFSRLANDTEGAVRSIFRFLGVDDNVAMPGLGKMLPEDIDFVIHTDQAASSSMDEGVKAELAAYYEPLNLKFAAALGLSPSELW